MSAQTRNLSVATELGSQVLERTRSTSSLIGFSYIPDGSYVFDGRSGDTGVGTTTLFPPAPYPSTKVNNQLFEVVVTGEELVPERVKNIRVDIYWNDTGHTTLETRMHL